jgi:hypothetical protein
MENYLQLISEYSLNKEEAIALRLMFIYLEICKKYFPESTPYYTFKKDPRKYETWKYCRKMLEETKGKLGFAEYRLFIEAQILVTIKISKKGMMHPSVLTGEAAWRRWQIWKKNFIKAKNIPVVQETTYEQINADDVKKELKYSKTALLKRLIDITPKNILDNMTLIMRLYRMGVISPFFLAMNPTTVQYIKDHNLEFNLYNYRKRLTEDVKKYYEELFPSALG